MNAQEIAHPTGAAQIYPASSFRITLAIIRIRRRLATGPLAQQEGKVQSPSLGTQYSDNKSRRFYASVGKLMNPATSLILRATSLDSDSDSI